MQPPSHSTSRVIPASEHRRERWRNQLGWTREIYKSPEQGGWDVRLSIAEIERDSAFSAFPGVDRRLVLLSGNGLRLRFDDGEVHDLYPPHGELRFEGERHVVGELIDGPTLDFNLMWRRDRAEADLWRQPLAGPTPILAEPRSTWAIYLLAGSARLVDAPHLPPLSAGDTALLTASDAPLRHTLDGDGEALVIRTAPLAPAQP